MSTEEYIARMKSLGIDREGLETSMPFTNPCCVMSNKVSAYLPGGEERSKRVPPPPYDTEDWSHLNSSTWKKHQAAGRKNRSVENE